MAARLFRCLLGKDGVLQSARWAADRNTLFGQAFNMDGQSSIFLQLEADIVPAPHHKFGAPTMSFHAIDAGPVAGDYMNVGVEEGLGNWLEFGCTRSNHTDGGGPAIRSLFCRHGHLQRKAKIIPAGAHKFKYVPAVSIGGVLRTNDPLVVQFVEHENATNGDIWRLSCSPPERSARLWALRPPSANRGL
jgi:hypothetical protein